MVVQRWKHFHKSLGYVNIKAIWDLQSFIAQNFHKVRVFHWPKPSYTKCYSSRRVAVSIILSSRLQCKLPGRRSSRLWNSLSIIVSVVCTVSAEPASRIDLLMSIECWLYIVQLTHAQISMHQLCVTKDCTLPRDPQEARSELNVCTCAHREFYSQFNLSLMFNWNLTWSKQAYYIEC